MPEASNKNIIVELASPERKYVKTFLDFLDNNFLTTSEQMVYIVLKSYVDFSADSGEVFPSIRTICKRSKLSESSVRRTINSLIKKGIVEKVQRGLTKTNLYKLADYPAMWVCEDLDTLKEIVKNQGIISLTPEEHIMELEKMGYKVEIKEKGLASESDQTTDTSTKPTKYFTNNNIIEKKSQVQKERYTLENIRSLYDYGNLLILHSAEQKDIDIVFDILYDTLNSTKATIRIGSEDKPAMAVIGKLMKLEPEDIFYSIRMFHEQTARIKNVKGYLLTILYHAKEQRHLDLMNLGHHNQDF